MILYFVVLYSLSALFNGMCFQYIYIYIQCIMRDVGDLSTSSGLVHAIYIFTMPCNIDQNMHIIIAMNFLMIIIFECG